MKSFTEMCEGHWQTTAYKKKLGDTSHTVPAVLVCFDPGETTGWAVYEFGKLAASGHLTTPPGEYKELQILLTTIEKKAPIDVILYEDYRVYASKVQQHTNNELWVPKLIGGICMYATLKGIALQSQMASMGKSFCGNDKLRAWGMYNVKHRHANDAIRHGAHWLLFAAKGNIPVA